MSNKLTKRIALPLLAAALGAAGPVMAQDFKIGISGAATGPASPSYLPHIEGIRAYVRQLNDKGGVSGKKIDLVVLDDKASPTEAASNAKRLMDDEQALAVGLMSLSSTYAPMFQAATRTKTPSFCWGRPSVPQTRPDRR